MVAVAVGETRWRYRIRLTVRLVHYACPALMPVLAPFRGLPPASAVARRSPRDTIQIPKREEGIL
jgi:hypothetical protein